MKAPILKAALLLAVSSLLVSCQKEVSDLASNNSLDSKAAVTKMQPQERGFNGMIITHTAFEPAEGWVPPNPVPAWYPGEGEGHASHIGQFYTYFNQFAYPDGTSTTTALGSATWVNKYYAAQLAAHGITVPNDIGTVQFDMDGNSIWAKGAYKYTILSLSQTLVEADLEIVNGTGRFTGAKGDFTLYGVSTRTNILEPSNDTLRIKGTIIY